MNIPRPTTIQATLLYLLLCPVFSQAAQGAQNLADYLCRFSQPVTRTELDGSLLKEISGLSISRQQEGVHWVLPDSGNPAEITAISSDGAILNRFSIDGARNRDWEDIALAESASGEPWLYIADIGDNKRRWDSVTVYRLKEPRVTGDGSTIVVHDYETLTFRYPDSRFNAEALFVDERSQRLFIVTKNTKKKFGWPFPDGPASVFSGSTVAMAEPVTLEYELMIDFVERASAGHDTYRDEIGTRPVGPAVTGADMHRNGVIAVRTYGSVWLWQAQPGEGIREAMLRNPCEAPSTIELGGEAIAITPDGQGYTTVPERNPALTVFGVPR